MKIKNILGLSFLMASLLCTSAILAEENDSSTKEAVQETTVETESTQQEEKTEQTTVAIPFRQDVMEAIAEYGYGVEEYYRPESTIMVDADTGEIVFGSNIDQPWDPASISKMMTAYMAFEAMKEGKLSLDTVVTATEEDRAISTIGEISNNIIVAGVDYPIEELLYMMFYPSSNVATLMVARATGLSDTEFLNKMNAKFKEWGMENTKFNNASGAVASAFRGYYTPEGYNNNRYNQTTARDLAILAYHFLKDFPEITNFTKNPLITVMVGTPYEESFYTYNSSIPGMYQGFPGVDGFKTGSSPSAAFNHLLTAKQEDTRFIQVILGVGAWEDKDNQDGKRPTSVTIKLLADGVKTGKKLVLTKANNWTGSFTDLDEYKAGKKIVYTIKEETVGNGYISVVTKTGENTFTVTNTREPETTFISGTKIWADFNNLDGTRPEKIKVILNKTVDGKTSYRSKRVEI